MLIILTGKTASGKDTILSYLLQKYPNLQKVVSSTTRIPRPGEKDDLDYHFLTENEFKEKIDKGEFIESVDYGGKFYGTTKTELAGLPEKDLIWKIDPSRAGEVQEFLKRSFPPDEAKKIIEQVLVIFITASDDVIMQRLKARALPQEEIDKRMSQDAKDWEKYKDSYDFVVENPSGKLQETIEKVFQIIESHRI